MKCNFRACKHNKDETCLKYALVEQMTEDFRKGGGCAFTWFFSGQLPTIKEVAEK